MDTRLALAAGSALLAATCCLSAADAAALDPTAALTPELAAQLSQNVNRQVIVVMKNILSGDDAAGDQAPVLSELGRVNARRVKSYRMVNALAATVSDDEIARLRVNPAVANVIPDTIIHRSKASAGIAAASAAGNSSTSLTPYVIPGACLANGKVSLEPEALQTTNTSSLDPHALTARSLGFTGAGVKVAYIADGVDTSNINFIRPDGSSAFIDYKDFSGDGAGQLTAGGEAFLDSNSVAGQGLHVYNVNGYGAQRDRGACNIRIEGMAPGASLVGLNVFGSFEDTTESNFLEAIEYAVVVDHVDVLNESFGSNPWPDITASDVTKQFNDAAVKAGVTVTVSSGDAGSTNTIGSPATDPLVIAAGASTTFRAYAQLNYAAARYFATSGWLDDNISSLSSGGFTETGATVDLVAPGDIGWASCDASALFTDCTNYVNQPSAVEESGGTSESAPLTAGAAALVIEAYRKSHHGSSPAPSLVKQILTSTATDLGTPATEQGAGLVNSYKAVLLAQSIDTNRPPAAANAQTLLLSHSQLNALGAPGSKVSWPVKITNPSASGQFVQLSGRTFGPRQNKQSGTVTLNDATSLQFVNYQGLQNNYEVINFKVPPGVDRLNASLAYPGAAPLGSFDPLNARVRMILIDPLGRFAAHSLPQGVGNYGDVDVREPVPGIWTGVIFGDVAAVGGTNGAIPWRVSTQYFVPFAAASPSAFYLSPGETQTVEIAAQTPESPGDAAGSIVVSASGDGSDGYVGEEHNSIAVTLRSLVDLDHGGKFNGVLTGGNGRGSGGQLDYFEFNVPPGHQAITANVSLSSDAGDTLAAYLINPDGVAVGFGANNATGANTLALTANAINPVAGTWTLIVQAADPIVGDELSQPFNGNVMLDDVHATAEGLPNTLFTRLRAGVPVTVPVTITNTGAAAESYFIDARLNTPAAGPLASLAPPPSSSGYPLPLGSTSSTATPLWLVPTETSDVKVTASATLPIEFDFGPYQGDPDIFGAPTGTHSAAGSYAPAGGTVTQGLWYANPTEIGPYSAPATAGFANATLVAVTKQFDAAVTSAPGDLWLAAVDPSVLNTFAPVTINPGESMVINVQITPTGPSGSVVSGNLYIDDYFGLLPVYGEFSGNEVTAIPYQYTVK
jgi:hypothetical protein